MALKMGTNIAAPHQPPFLESELQDLRLRLELYGMGNGCP